ncbi:MAG TPA: hypothetical protein VFO60_06930 [Candidatus Dormibacteraeota bacterium]|nr:hypothetical protein [Candidatus Dormibacteraeota bacterium]
MSGSEFIVQVAVVAVMIATGCVLWFVIRTNPRVTSARRLTALEAAVAPWLWQRDPSPVTRLLGRLVIAGGALCALTVYLPIVTSDYPPLYLGDPLAGSTDDYPTVHWVAFILGVVVLLLGLRRATGRGGITVPVALILATLVELAACLAIADHLRSGAPPPGPHAPTVSVGVGIVVLPLGAALAIAASAADLVRGLSAALRREQGDPTSGPVA